MYPMNSLIDLHFWFLYRQDTEAYSTTFCGICAKSNVDQKLGYFCVHIYCKTTSRFIWPMPYCVSVTVLPTTAMHSGGKIRWSESL